MDFEILGENFQFGFFFFFVFTLYWDYVCVCVCLYEFLMSERVKKKSDRGRAMLLM